MSVRPDVDFAIEAASWNYQQFALHLHHGERRPARAAEALAVSSCRQVELRDFMFA